MARGSGRGKGDEARVRVAFRVPLEFAFAWCTDYTPGDAALEGESYLRKVVERTPRRVIFEDLEETPSGWIWGRDVVTLRPPRRWHMEGVGSHRDVTADYVLTKLPDGRTQMELRWWRRAKPLGKKIPRRRREQETTRAWKRFAAAMERDYRRSKRKG
ncbi:MAG TPA: hypothetical protein VEY12_02460 [Thermoplasmata archaeon]|nr:hypothetical protein [Thermoplasmata archaeon]